MMGWRDVLYPAGDPENEADKWEWDVVGANRFDERSTEILKSKEALIVKSIHASIAGDLTIRFDGAQSLEVIIDNSLPTEQWRFFGGHGHLVVTPTGLEEDAPHLPPD
jgi:hypothetical protein